MEEFRATYERAVTTGRPGELLAQRHGFGTIALLAASLPPSAQVLDIGAGASRFGEEVACLRPDVSWVNFDYSYNDPEIMDEVSQDSSPSVRYIAGDATQLGTEVDKASQDLVFSYWMFPHLSVDSVQPAVSAAKNIFDVLKPGGLASIGPRVSLGHMHWNKRRESFHIVKDGSVNESDFVQHILEETQHSEAAKLRRQFRYDVAMDYFGTTRWRKDNGKSIYSPSKESYVPLKSLQGAATIAMLGVAAVRHRLKNASHT